MTGHVNNITRNEGSFCSPSPGGQGSQLEWCRGGVDMYQDRRCRTATADLGLILVALPIIALAVCIIAIGGLRQRGPCTGMGARLPGRPRPCQGRSVPSSSRRISPTAIVSRAQAPTTTPSSTGALARHSRHHWAIANGFAEIGGELDGFFYISQYPKAGTAIPTFPPSKS